MGATLVAAAALGAARSPADPVEPVEVLIDAAHGNAFACFEDANDGLPGLTNAFLRRGRLARIHRGWPEEISPATNCIVVIDPRVDYSVAEIEAIERFVEGGGSLWLFASRTAFERAPRLFDTYGAALLDVPLSSADDATDVRSGARVSFRRAWPVTMVDAEVLVRAWTFDLAVRRRIGAGEVILVGDPTLFLGAGIEARWKIQSDNARFFDTLVPL
jgi:hypothetical protein